MRPPVAYYNIVDCTTIPSVYILSTQSSGRDSDFRLALTMNYSHITDVNECE